AHDLEEATQMPDLDNSTNASGRHGFGQLGANLEFLMLKVAQLETIVELQQIEIHSLNEWKRGQTGGQAAASEAETKAREVAGTQKATEVLKKVLHKHNHQRDRREFSSHQQKRGSEEQRKPKEDEASRSSADEGPATAAPGEDV
ncbi:unnamed protein product, partial [Symbiodinium necroappetens]